METSIFLAKFWGWYLMIFFFILSFNPKRVKRIFDDLKDQKFIIVAAYIAIVVGLLNILFHNLWVADWRFVVTAIGWISLGIGLSLFTFPERTAKWLEFINMKLVQLIYMLLFLIGMFLLNMGYQIVPF